MRKAISLYAIGVGILRKITRYDNMHFETENEETNIEIINKMPPMWRNMYTKYPENTLKLWITYYSDRREPRSYEWIN